MSKLVLTPSQTVGPFFSSCLLCEGACRNELVGPETKGERIRIEGRIIDGDGLPVPDAMVEIWQANADGRYNHSTDQGTAVLDPTFTGFGRAGTDEQGSYWFETVKPGAVRFDDTRLQAPHVCVTIFARGLLNHLVTRLYFADEAANADDPVLNCVPEERRGTLVAKRKAESVVAVYCFDIILQGAGETAFFNV
jgi:protocatechuate 3,4-dioxygenase alpha subunit